MTIRKLFSLLVFFFLITPITAKIMAQSNPSLGVSVKASTNGVGGDIIFAFSDRISARVGFEGLAFSTLINFSEYGIDYDAAVDLSVGGASILCDFYLSRIVYITTGAAFNQFKIGFKGNAASSISFGDIEISPERIGDFKIEGAPFNTFAPYVGIGLGRTLSARKKVAFAFEVGSYYQGPINVTVTSTGLLTPTSDPDFGQEKLFERQIDQYTWYPIVKLSLSYKIVTL